MLELQLKSILVRAKKLEKLVQFKNEELCRLEISICASIAQDILNLMDYSIYFHSNKIHQVFVVALNET